MSETSDRGAGDGNLSGTSPNRAAIIKMGVEEVIYNVAVFVAGLIILVPSSDKFVDYAAKIARRLNVSPTLITLVTAGAEWEELVVIAVSLAQGKPSLALGALYGSSIGNILGSFSIGMLFFTGATAFDRSSKIYTAILLASTTVFLLFLFTLSGWARILGGVLLVVAFLGYLASAAVMIFRGVLEAPEASDSESDSSSEGNSSDEDVDDSSDDEFWNGKTESAKGKGKFHDTASRSHPPEEGEGSARGSTSTDTTEQALLMQEGLDSPRPGQDETASGDELGGSSETAASQRSKQQRKPQPRRKPHAKKEKKKRRPQKTTRHLVLLMLLSLGALVLSSYVLAHSAAAIGEQMGMSQSAIGATLLAVATTLPEKVVSIAAGARKQPDIVVANAIGSNIFLSLLCGGLVLLLADRQAAGPGSPDALFGSLAMWASAALLFVVVVIWQCRRWVAGAFLGLYILFLIVAFVRGWDMA